MKKITGKDALKIEAPYEGVSQKDYHIEKRRLQLELLKIQHRVADQGERICICFDGREAAGKGSTIERFTENLMPKFYRHYNLGVPTPEESKHWFKRYEKLLPKPGQMVFFDRSWYNRALIEPTMGYCTQRQYEYFMDNVLQWEHKLIDDGLKLVKFYLSVDQEHQFYRFQERLNDPLKFWKFSEKDMHARKKWETYTKYKEQMYSHTASEKSPWVIIDSNSRRTSRLACMLYVVKLYGNKKFVPLTGDDVIERHSIMLKGVTFNGLNKLQYSVLKELDDDLKSNQGEL